MFVASAPDAVGGAANTLIEAGPYGAVLLLAFAFFYVVWKAERERANRADAAKDAMVRELIDKVMPALAEATRVQRDFVDLSRTIGRRDNGRD